MIHGIYGARFTSNGQDFVGGIVVIDVTSFHGGDPDYLYTGHYWLQDDYRLEANVQVQNYTGRLNSIVGAPSSFEDTLTGVADSETIRLSGAVAGQVHRTIQITLTKISDLVDPSRGCFEAACAVVASTPVGAACTVSQGTHQPTGLERTEAKQARRRTRDR